MSKFLIRRVAFAILIIFFGSFITYAVIRMLPTSFVESMAMKLAQLPNAKSYQEWLDQLNANYGLDLNIFSGFLRWASNALRGEFGDSWAYTIPVVDQFKSVVWYSVIIQIFTLVIELIVSIPLGITAAKRQYSKTDYGVTVFALLGISLPSFFFASMMRYVFAVKLQWFELYGIISRNHIFMNPLEQIGDIAWHLVLPVATLMMTSIGGLMRYTRTNMLEVLNADYIRTARAKGLPEKRVINQHAFRNTLIPLVTYFSYLLPVMFGGFMITEQIFAIPGIGYTAFNAMTQGDIPFTMFYMVFIIILTQISLIIADVMYAVVDPRVRIS
ncbi:MAG: ABC transporter permease [Clostridiales bacterium]|jgi:peptide/nickel transport system permease protein|nr:ABC transporter permease [Clostridiales bacterium]